MSLHVTAKLSAPFRAAPSPVVLRTSVVPLARQALRTILIAIAVALIVVTSASLLTAAGAPVPNHPGGTHGKTAQLRASSAAHGVAWLQPSGVFAHRHLA
jgi:hypothetical protein